ncbi:hypothetical protein NDU88_004609 [Pleurodeles waltl]|uniref:Uncharacterized protein n=1 Tax=Pleurodeles waltl TaxID=8319 RepID=A0AAV7MEH6_PLEWA|nr:hypothetical protein NDU88_004609 [Pleurodeles waltl]
MPQVTINTSLAEPPKESEFKEAIKLLSSGKAPDAFCDDEETIIKIRYRTDGRLFNLQRLQAKTKVGEDSVRGFLFADDCALNSATEAQM